MPGVLIKGWTLITERESGIWILGYKDGKAKLYNIENLKVSDIFIYWRKPKEARELLKLLIEPFGFNHAEVDPDILNTKFDVVQVEVDLGDNTIDFI